MKRILEVERNIKNKCFKGSFNANKENIQKNKLNNSQQFYEMLNEEGIKVL